MYRLTTYVAGVATFASEAEVIAHLRDKWPRLKPVFHSSETGDGDLDVVLWADAEAAAAYRRPIGYVERDVTDPPWDVAAWCAAYQIRD